MDTRTGSYLLSWPIWAVSVFIYFPVSGAHLIVHEDGILREPKLPGRVKGMWGGRGQKKNQEKTKEKERRVGEWRFPTREREGGGGGGGLPRRP